MPEMITGKKTQRYSTEFKVKAVEWSHQAHRSVKGVAEALDILPLCCHAGERNTERDSLP